MITITDSGEDRERRVREQAGVHDGAEPTASDEPRDDDHRQREEDGLVEAEEEHASRHRKLDLQEHLATGGTHRRRRLDGVHRYSADAESGDAYARRDRVDHRRDDGGRVADREEEDDRHQVRERRDDLCGVEERGQDAVEAPRASCGDAQGHSDEDRQPDRREHERQRLHALRPEARDGERRECGECPDTGTQSAETPGEQRACNGRPDPREPDEEVVEPGDEVVGEDPEAVEEREEDPPPPSRRWSIR